MGKVPDLGVLPLLRSAQAVLAVEFFLSLRGFFDAFSGHSPLSKSIQKFSLECSCVGLAGKNKEHTQDHGVGSGRTGSRDRRDRRDSRDRGDSKDSRASRDRGDSRASRDIPELLAMVG